METTSSGLGSDRGLARIQCDQGALADGLWRAGRCHPYQQPKAVIKLNQRSRAAVVCLKTHSYRLWPIIFSLKQSTLATIADPRSRRRPLGHMVYGLALFAGAPSPEPRDNFAGRQFVIDDRGERDAFLFRQSLQGLGLADRSRETIENEAALATQAILALSNHLPHDRVWDQFAPAHVLPRLAHGWGLIAIRLAGGATENVSSRQMASSQLLVQEIGLRPLTDSGSAKQNQPQRLTIVRLNTFTASGWTLQPSRAFLASLCHYSGTVFGRLASCRDTDHRWECPKHRMGGLNTLGDIDSTDVPPPTLPVPLSLSANCCTLSASSRLPGQRRTNAGIHSKTIRRQP